MGSFSKQVAKFADEYEKRLRAVGRTAVQDTVSMAETVRKKGGRMRVKTGFLRASGQGAIGSMPEGPVQPKKGAKDGDYRGKIAGAPLSSVLLNWDPNKNEKLFYGWTANYARFRESQDGFLRGAAEKWDITVKRSVIKVRASGV